MASAEALADEYDMNVGRCPACGAWDTCECRPCDAANCDEYGPHVQRVRPVDLDLCPAHSDYEPEED